MKKIISFAVASIATLLLGGGIASAATVNNVLFDTGAGNVSVSPGSTVTMHAWITAAPNENIQCLYVKFPNAGGIAQQGAPYTVNPQKMGQSPVNGWDVTVPVVVPLGAGTRPDVQVTSYGVNGNGDQVDPQCQGSPNSGMATFSNRIVLSDTTASGSVIVNSGGTGSISTGSGFSFGGMDITGLIALLKSLGFTIGSSTIGTTTPPAPTKPSGCDQVVAYNGYNAAAAQQSLFGVAAGAQVFNQHGVFAPTGHFGSISAQAQSAVMIACK